MLGIALDSGQHTAVGSEPFLPKTAGVDFLH